VKYTAVGRRKTATAKVYLVPGARSRLPAATAPRARQRRARPRFRAEAPPAWRAGTGVITFNGRDCLEYLGNNPFYVASVRDPLEVLGLESLYDVVIKASGGGVMGQAEAARLGISRALVESDEAHRPALKAEGFMKRDPRSVERKKYGLHKARRRKQYSKR